MKKVSKWAEELDEEDEEVEEEADEDENQDNEDNEDDDDDDEDDEVEEIQINLSLPTKPAVAPNEEIKKDLQNLSKKEKKLLKQKELEDLDSLLMGYKSEVVEDVTVVGNDKLTAGNNKEDNDKTVFEFIKPDENKLKKKKNNKKKVITNGTNAEIVSEPSPSDLSSNTQKENNQTSSIHASVVAPSNAASTTVDVSTILKMKAKKNTSKKASPSSGTAAEIQRLAMAEALKAKQIFDKNKKKDKSKYNETSY